MNFRNIFTRVKPAVSRKKLIIIGLVVIFLILAGAGAIVFLKYSKKSLNPEEARVMAEKFINDNLLPSNVKATVKSAALEGDVYNISLNVQGKDYTSYMTKDGSKFFQTGIDVASYLQEVAAQKAAENKDNQKADAEIPKTDKPKVELFVMTYCPYGLQAEKGILPALAALGNKIDAKIRFVHYFMHGDKEEQETYNQVCIRQEQAAKFDSYLNCFTVQGDSAKCITEAGIDKAKLTSCVASKAKDYYKADSDLSQGYGVTGSPTLAINGVQSSAGRDAASYLAGICDAFKTKPAECSKKLSSASPSSGFGAGTDSGGSASAADCAQ